MILKNGKLISGIVEDNASDPLKLGRCKVRLFGIHNEKKEVAGPKGIPTEDLPWALPLSSLESGLMSGLGTGPVRITNGSEVLCLVRDDLYQDIVMIGVIPGVHIEPAKPEIGFQDPSGTYPLEDRLEEPDTNRLARKEKFDETILLDKTARVLKDIPMKGGGSWSEPLPVDYINPEYPKNQVTETESGHVFEIDDTPGFERISTWHKSGAFDETINTGERIIKVPNNMYITIEEGELAIYSGGGISLTAKQDISILTEGAFAVQAKNGIKLDSETEIQIQSKLRTSIDGANVSVNR